MSWRKQKMKTVILKTVQSTHTFSEITAPLHIWMDSIWEGKFQFRCFLILFYHYICCRLFIRYTRGEGGPGLIDQSQPNKITIKFTPSMSISVKIWLCQYFINVDSLFSAGKSFDRYVVDTDYENYAVLIGCKEKKGNHLSNCI